MRTISMSFVASVLISTTLASAAEAACYIAFIHGAGPDDTAATDVVVTYPMVRGTANSYWWPSNTGPNSSFVSNVAHIGSTDQTSCTARLITYNATDRYSWWAVTGDVGRNLKKFITEAQIPNGELIIVGHSMGGIMGRFVVNTGSPGNSFYPGYNGDWTAVTAATRYIITVQSPHMGTKGADVLDGNSNDSFANAVGALVEFLGLRKGTLQSHTLTTSVMEDGSPSESGWINDAFRSQHIWGVAGLSTGPESREQGCPGTNNDCLLSVAWGAIYPNNDEDGDGLVERYSAQGWNPSTGQWLTGMVTWIDSQSNHNQGRYGVHTGALFDWKFNNFQGAWQRDRLSMYIGYSVDQLW